MAVTRGKSERIDVFCAEYVSNGFRSARAAIAAGYSEASAGTQASELLRMPDVQRKIAALKREYFKAMHMDKTELLSRTAAMGRADPDECFDDEGKLLPLKKIPAHIRACITEYDPKKGTVKLEPRVPALQMLGRYHRILGESLEVTGAGGKDLVPDKPDPIEVAKRVAFILTQAARKQKQEA